MIVGTAGHVDHGKTALIRALTGIDTDRLKEEKRRGISIDLGFAYLALPGGEALGFVDVPGHERFIRNMLAGAGAIDFVLLVVAADDGVMPQTAEHAAILDLLGLSRGIVVLTKCDLVDERRIAEVDAEARALLRSTRLAGCPVIAVSTRTGSGVAQLSGMLESEALAAPRQVPGGNFRLAVDRCFTLPGAGTVVTGSVSSGRIALGDQVIVSPGGLEARVRGIRAQNRVSDFGAQGQRCALNLVGRKVGTASVFRGDWIVAAEAHAPVERFDAELQILAGERALRHWSSVHLHHGTSFANARVAVLEGDAVAPGERALVQVVLDRPVAALFGDRFVIRESSAQRTLGGGRVLDPFPPDRDRRSPRRLAMVRALREPDAAGALRASLAAGAGAVDLAAFACARNLTPDEARALLAGVPHTRIASGERRLAFDPPRWALLREAVLAAVAEKPGATLAQIRSRCPDRRGAEDLAVMTDSLLADGQLLRSESRYRLPGSDGTLPDADERLHTALLETLAAAGSTPPRVRELASRLAADEKRVRRALRWLASRGALYRVNEDRYFSREALDRLARRTRELLAAEPDGLLGTASLRDGLGIGRNLLIEVLEFFDREGLTERVPEGRRLGRPRGQEQRKGSAPGGASGLQIRKGPSAVPGGFDSHSLPPSDEASR